ncbi:MAG: hypothetical protein ABI398_05525 [Devosia sp.]
MHERDIIFRERLVALMSDLNGGEGRDKQLRRLIGLYSEKLAREAGARNWADLKSRADAPTYDSMLQLFQKQSEAAAAKGDDTTVRVFEVLAISLIARRQYQDELLPGVDFLDRYIEECAQNARAAGGAFITPPASARH